MQRDTARPEYGTINRVARELGIGPKALKRAVKSGACPAVTAGTAWPRVRYDDARAWLVSTRVRTTPHARARVDEILAREQAAASRP